MRTLGLYVTIVAFVSLIYNILFFFAILSQQAVLP